MNLILLAFINQIIIMRNSFDIIPNPNLKGLSCRFPSIPSLQPNSIIKLSQNKNSIYLRYTPSSQLPSSTSTSTTTKIQLPSKLCQFNNLTQGSAQIQPILNIKQCRKLSIYVNKLDWQIINNKVQMLQQQFMNQVQIIWPNAYIPIFYNINNFIKLRIQCQCIGYLIQNSELEILVDKQFQQKDKQQYKQKIYRTDKLKILLLNYISCGNINKIYITKQHQFYKQQVNKQKQKLKQKSIKQKQKQQQINQSKKQTNKQKQQQKQIKITSQILNQLYIIKLKYLSCNIEQNKAFPCDTNQMNIKDQINLIKSISNNNNKSHKNKDIQKYQSLLVEVRILQNQKQIQDLYYRQTGKNIQTYQYNQIKPVLQNKKQSSQQSSSSQQSNKVIINQQQQKPKFRAITPISIQKQPINTLYINEALIKNWNIDPKKQIKLQIFTKINQLGNSKKLQYLLNLNGFNIDVIISQKNQINNNNNYENIKQNIVNSFIQNWKKQKQQNGNCLTVYSKIPYLFKLGNINKFAYINFKQNNNQIGDPLIIFYNIKKIVKQKQTKIEQKQKSNKNSIQSIKQKLINSINIQNYFYGNQNVDEVKVKTGLLWKLNCIGQKQFKENNKMEKQKQNKNKKQLKQGKSNEEVFIQLYKICYQNQINKVMDFIKSNSNIKSAEANNSLLPLVLTSFANNGKTVMNKILRQNDYKTLYIDMSQMDDTSHNITDLSQYLQLTFQMYQGACIFMDNLDSVCYKIDQGDLHRKQQRIAAKLILRQIIKYSKQYKKFCIFTAKNQTNIDEQLVHYELIKLKNPIRQIRQKILNQFNSSSEGKQIYNRQKINQIIENSESMSFGQFSKFVISGHREQKNLDAGVSMDFKKLAGIKQVKNTLRTVVERPLKYSFVFKKLPIKLSRGVLLYGGSGTGKSAVGEALAGQFKMKFFTVKGSDILSKYIGGSEAAVRDVFQKAMSVSPSIVFFDQFQSIVPRRNSSNTGVTDRVVNQFLCYLDGVASVQGVYIIAASSRPQLIDPALLRPGRIDTHIFLDYPTKDQREQLFGLYNNSITFDSSMNQLLDMTEDFSYSDLIGLIKQLRIKQSAKIIKQSANIHEMKIQPKQFKHISAQFFKETMKDYKIPMSKQQKIRQREKFLKFKRGDAPDVSKQKVVLQ